VSRSERVKVNAPQVVGEVIDGEAIIVNLKSGIYYSLAGPGGLVWSCIERQATRAEITAAVRARYSAETGVIETDVARLVDELVAEGLAVPADAAGEPAPPGGACQDSEMATPYEAPVLNRYEDMHDLLLLDPIHEVDQMGWPNVKPAQEPT